MTAMQRRRAAVRAGEVDLSSARRRLLQEDVEFAKLGLVVIDEQHKFGVNQRARVKKLGVDPHYLVMTATPIPRTIALSIFGDLDTSTIKQMPPGRQPMRTRWWSEGQRTSCTSDSPRTCGRAIFVVCRWRSRQRLDVKAATQTHAELRTGPFGVPRRPAPRTNGRGRRNASWGFRDHKLDVLVSTSVVESAWIAKRNADGGRARGRFGLSRLHQLRDRVSRGEVAGGCHLFSDPAGSARRLRVLSERRTASRWPGGRTAARLGQFFGTRQHGLENCGSQI
jgi:ATP-dependent DNA helicase RecG